MVSSQSAYPEEVLAEVVLHQPGKGRKPTEVGGATFYHHGDEVKTNGYQRVSIMPKEKIKIKQIFIYIICKHCVALICSQEYMVGKQV